MVKIFFKLLFIFVVANIFGFNYQNYKDATLDDIIKYVNIENYNKDKTDFDSDIYPFNFTLKIKIINYPITLDPTYEYFKKTYNKAFNLHPNFESLFNYQMKINYKNTMIIFIFQDSLIPFLKDEVKINDEIYLYCNFGIIKMKTKEIIIFVNEFSDKKLN